MQLFYDLLTNKTHSSLASGIKELDWCEAPGPQLEQPQSAGVESHPKVAKNVQSSRRMLATFSYVW